MTKNCIVMKISMLLGLLPALIGCSGIFGPESPPAESVTAVNFKKNTITIPAGGSEYLQLTVKPAGLQNSVNIVWDYDPAHIAINPDAYGVVITGVTEGSTYIKAAVNGITATCMITVQGVDGEYTGQPYIYSNHSVLEMIIDSTRTISASLYGGQSYDLEDFTFSVRDPAIARIAYTRNNCIITAANTGSTQITASHPKSAYPYTFIVYVYTDELTESYLTTTSNIITVNRTQTPSFTVSVEVQNPRGMVRQEGFSWEPVNRDETENPLSITANGGTAVLTALRDGLSMLRVRYDGCAWPLDILVRITSTVQNVYIIPSTSTLIVTGSTAPYSIRADITGYSGFVNPDAFVWTVPDEASRYFDYETVGNTLSVTGKINGAVKVNVSHELCEYSRNILIVLREQAGSAIDASMYITTSGNYIQTKVGDETTRVSVTIAGGKAGDEQDLVWTIDNGVNNDICLIETPNGRVAGRAMGQFAGGTLYVTPRNIGTATVTISHPKILYETEILIRVFSPWAQLEEPVVLTSQTGLIRMLNGSSREVSVNLGGNIRDGDEYGITWHSGNEAAVSLSPLEGSITIATAGGTGSRQTYITAAHPKAAGEKRILVLTADTQETLDTMKGIHTDKTYFRINENTTARLCLDSFGLDEADSGLITWTTDRPGVCIVQGESGNRRNASVTGISAGTAIITAALSGCEPCRFNLRGFNSPPLCGG